MRKNTTNISRDCRRCFGCFRVVPSRFMISSPVKVSENKERRFVFFFFFFFLSFFLSLFVVVNKVRVMCSVQKKNAAFHSWHKLFKHDFFRQNFISFCNKRREKCAHLRCNKTDSIESRENVSRGEVCLTQKS